MTENVKGNKFTRFLLRRIDPMWFAIGYAALLMFWAHSIENILVVGFVGVIAGVFQVASIIEEDLEITKAWIAFRAHTGARQ